MVKNEKMTSWERLDAFVAFIPTIPVKFFSMSHWGKIRGDFVPGLQNSDVEKLDFTKVISSLKNEPECGTAACLAGWAASAPTLKKQGIKLAFYDRCGRDVFASIETSEKALPSNYTGHRGMSRSYTAQDFFNLSIDEDDLLFHSYEVTDPRAFIRAIKVISAAHKKGRHLTNRELLRCEAHIRADMKAITKGTYTNGV